MATRLHVALRLKQLRRARGWTQQALGTKARISRGYLLRLEAAQQDPPLGVLTRLAQALGVSTATLTGPPLATRGARGQGCSGQCREQTAGNCGVDAH